MTRTSPPGHCGGRHRRVDCGVWLARRPALATLLSERSRRTRWNRERRSSCRRRHGEIVTPSNAGSCPRMPRSSIGSATSFRAANRPDRSAANRRPDAHRARVGGPGASPAAVDVTPPRLHATTADGDRARRAQTRSRSRNVCDSPSVWRGSTTTGTRGPKAPPRRLPRRPKRRIPAAPSGHPNPLAPCCHMGVLGCAACRASSGTRGPAQPGPTGCGSSRSRPTSPASGRGYYCHGTVAVAAATLTPPRSL